MVDLKDPRTVVKWLKNCNEDPKTPDRCHRCPYGIFANGGGEHSCMDELHSAPPASSSGRSNRPGRDNNVEQSEYPKCSEEI